MLTFSEMPTPFVEALLTRPLAERETLFGAPRGRRPRMRLLLLTTLLLALFLT